MKKRVSAFTVGWIMCAPLLAADALSEDNLLPINPLARSTVTSLAALPAWEVETTDDEATSGNNSDSDSSSDDELGGKLASASSFSCVSLSASCWSSAMLLLNPYRDSDSDTPSGEDLSRGRRLKPVSRTISVSDRLKAVIKPVENVTISDSDTDSSSGDSSGGVAMSAAILQMRLQSSSPDLPISQTSPTTSMRIKCVSIEFQSPEIRNADTLQNSIEMGCAFITSSGFAMNQVPWVLDVDGTTNTYPDPSKTYEWNFGPREESLLKVRDIKSKGGLVYFSSAWNDSLNGAERAFDDTLNRLRSTGFTNDDLGIGEGEVPVKVFVELQTQLLGNVYLVAYKCGNVVSCTSPTKPGLYFRGKFFAPAIARPELCPVMKALIEIDDGRSNLEALISDSAQHNPYGAETITFLPILLAEYKLPLVVSAAV